MGLSTGTRGGNTRKKVTVKAAGKAVTAGAGKRARPASRPPTARTLNGIGTAAVKKATGKGWDEWVRILDRDGAARMSHKEIAVHLHENRGVGEWWCQMVTVGYEHAKGRRETHQRPDGYEVSVNKTLAAPVSAVVEALQDPKVRAKWLPRERIEIRGVSPGKAVRINWGDGTNVIVGFYGSTMGKARVSVQHGKLKDAKEAERVKGYWKERLVALQRVLESA